MAAGAVPSTAVGVQRGHSSRLGTSESGEQGGFGQAIVLKGPAAIPFLGLGPSWELGVETGQPLGDISDPNHKVLLKQM